MPDYPCAIPDCDKTVTLQRPPTRGVVRCRRHKLDQRAELRRKRIAKSAKSVPNQPGEGVRFTAGKTKKADGRLDRLAALYLELTDTNGRPVYHADRCDYLRLAAAFAEEHAPEHVKRCEKLYERMSER